RLPKGFAEISRRTSQTTTPRFRRSGVSQRSRVASGCRPGRAGSGFGGPCGLLGSLGGRLSRRFSGFFGRGLSGNLTGLGHRSFGLGGSSVVGSADLEGLGVLCVVLGPSLLGFGRVATDVVALVVVRVLAEVRLVLGGDHATLGSLLDGKADSATLQVEIDVRHPHPHTGGD